MKNSKEYSNKVKKLYASLKRDNAKVQKITYDDPVEAIVFGVVSEYMSLSETKSVVRKLLNHFVDYNDLRVGRSEEIIYVLGDKQQRVVDMSEALKDSLYAVFNKYGRMSLAELKDMTKKAGRQELISLGAISPFVVNYVVLTALGGHAMPVTKKMAEYLKADELVDSGAEDEDIARFLERQISASEAYSFYELIRRQSDSAKVKKAIKKKTDVKKSVEKKAAVKKKTTEKKKAKKTAPAKKKKTSAKKKTAVKKKKKG